MDIAKVRNKINKFKYKNKIRRYYIEKYNNGKTYGAFIIDKIFLNILSLVILIGLINYLSHDLNFSIIISLQFFVLYIVLSYKVYKAKLTKSINKTNEKTANKYIIDNLINKSPSDFLEFVKNTLTKYNIENINVADDKDIDFIGTLKDKKIAIKSFQYNLSYKVSENDLRMFFLAIRKLEIDEGIIITTSQFDNEADEFINKVKGYVKFNKIDNKIIINILKNIGEYPTRKEIERIISSQINERIRVLSEKRKDSMLKGSFTRYFFSGLFIIVIGKLTPFGKFYSIMGLILVTFSFIKLIKNILLLVKPKILEKEDVLS